LAAARNDVHQGACGFWRWPALLTFICFLSVIVSFRKTLLSMEHTWYSSRTFSHGFLIFPLFLYLLWIRRKRISALFPSPNYWGLPLLSFLSALWLTLSNVPAVLENRVLSVPSGSWTVAEACSGIRYLFSSVALGVIFASLMYRSRKRRLAFVAASIAIPILANGVRGYGIVLLAYLTDNRFAVGVDHIVYGWLFFTVVQLVLFAVGMRWRERSHQKEETEVTNLETTAAALQNPGHLRDKTSFIAATAALLLVLPTPLVAAHLWNRATVFAALPELSVRVALLWQTAPTNDMSWVPDLRDPGKRFSQTYESGQHQVGLHWALYSGRDRMELVSDYNRVVNPRLWSSVADGFEPAVIGGQSIKVHQTILESGTALRTVWTWYWLNGEYTASPIRVKFLQAKARLLGHPAVAIIITVGTNFEKKSSESKQVLQDFLSHGRSDRPCYDGRPEVIAIRSSP
jgi:EpsI family protein